MKHTLAFAALLLSMCTKPTPQPVEPQPGPDGAAPDQASRVCANLRRLECPEGNKGCEEVLRIVATERLTDLKPQCLEAASSRDAVRACGQPCR